VTSRDFRPHLLPAGTPSLTSGVPPAPAPPPGALFALAADGGFAAPPEFTLLFGRNKNDVHVPIGVSDPYVSRTHGVVKGDGREWWIRNNKDSLPIQLPGDVLLLAGQEMPLAPGYTPLFISTSKRRSHLLELHIVGARRGGREGEHHGRTKPPEVYDLNPDERLVLTALAQRYLRQDRYPQPVSWKLVADTLNGLDDGRHWTQNKAAHIVNAVRQRLAAAPDPVPGIRREDGVGEPVGNTLNHNLIQALLLTSTLVPSDLDLLGEDPDDG
jgi:hypothetical protein